MNKNKNNLKILSKKKIYKNNSKNKKLLQLKMKFQIIISKIK